MSPPTLELYSSQRCPYAFRTRVVLHEKGLAFRHAEVNLLDKPADFARISPYGKVPVLVDGDARVYESNIINEYLDEKYPDPPLLPRTPAGRAHVRVWIDFFETRVVATMRKLRSGSEAERETVRKEVSTHLFTLGEVLGDGPWLCGADYSLADATSAPLFERLPTLGIDLAPHAKIVAWGERVMARPSYAAAKASPKSM